MPVTQWDKIIGERCVDCGKWASHWYGSIPLCCQCHGGNLYTEKETMVYHRFCNILEFIPSSKLVALILNERDAIIEDILELE